MTDNMRLLVLLSIFGLLLECDGLLAPSYVSEWLWMDVNNVTTTDVTLNHTFGVRPVKADVQVKSPVTNFTYPGVRSAHSQSEDGKRGGVICLYGENTVRLLGATNDNSDSSMAYIIYTGTTTWSTENGEELEAAWVRVRLWNPADLPPPSITISTGISAEEINKQPAYEELAHNLTTLPVLTVVQYYNKNPASYFATVVAEAQGTNSIQTEGHSNALRESSFLFAVNSSHIRLWAFNNKGGAHYGIFSFCGGWGYFESSQDNCYFREASVNISFWTELDSGSLVTQQTSHSVSDSSSHEYSMIALDADKDLVMVTSTPTDGVNAGFEFDGTGAAMSDGIANSSGLIYAYNEDGRVRLWHPLSQYCIVQVGPLMGADTNNQCAQDVVVNIRVWRVGCSLPEVENAVASGSVDSVTYTCKGASLHMSGDLDLLCHETNRTWNGTFPVCKKCETLSTGKMASLDSYQFGRTPTIANFTCLDGYYLESGNLIRTCDLPNATWSGAPPICVAILQSTSPSTAPTTTIAPTTTTTDLPTTTSTTPGTTTLPSVAEVCYNVTNIVYNITTLTQQTEEIIANLTVDAKSTSKFERSRTSAKDGRSSSMYIGLIGYLIFGIMGALIFLPDFFSVVRYILCRQNRNT